MNRLTKNERLRSRKLIEQLLTNGNSFFVHPFRIVSNFEFRVSTDNEITNYELRITNNNFQFSIFNFQLLIAAPKRRIKKAVARNLIKRRTREAWRLHKHQLGITNYELGIGNQVSGIRYQEMESGGQKMETNKQISKSTNNQLITHHSSLINYKFPVILQYVADEPLPYAVIEDAIKTIIRRLGEQV